MAKNLKFFFNESGVPCARGPQSEKLLMSFLETDIQGDDHICHDLMEDLQAIESGVAEEREFTGNAHTVTIKPDGISIHCHAMDDDSADETSSATSPASETAGAESVAAKSAIDANDYSTSLRHFKEIVEDWEAFILDEADDLPDADDMHV